jgi:GNAT superfamily N-acetyltransferase
MTDESSTDESLTDESPTDESPTDESPTGVEVREAAPDDRLDVRRVLDAAMLAVRDDLPERIDAGDVLVAEARAPESDRGPVLGALVLVPRGDAPGAHVDAVAVRCARRGQGVGSALVRAAAERHPVLTATFDPGVGPFYESLGFEISPAEGDDGDDDGGDGDDGGGDRLRGRFDASGE